MLVIMLMGVEICLYYTFAFTANLFCIVKDGLQESFNINELVSNVATKRLLQLESIIGIKLLIKQIDRFIDSYLYLKS